MKSNFKEFLSILDSALEPPDDPMFRPKKTVVTYNLNKPKWFYPSLTAACCIACIGVTLAVSLPVTINKDYSVQRVNNEAKKHYGSKKFEELFSRALIDQKIYLSSINNNYIQSLLDGRQGIYQIGIGCDGDTWVYPQD